MFLRLVQHTTIGIPICSAVCCQCIQVKTCSKSSFLPLFSLVCHKFFGHSQMNRLMGQIGNPMQFTPYTQLCLYLFWLMLALSFCFCVDNDYYYGGSMRDINAGPGGPHGRRPTKSSSVSHLGKYICFVVFTTFVYFQAFQIFEIPVLHQKLTPILKQVPADLVSPTKCLIPRL